jgi:hypothetical protein
VKRAAAHHFIKPEEIESLMLEEWFIEARLREHGYRQIDSVDNMETWTRESDTSDYRCITIQREGLTQRLLFRRQVSPSETDLLRVWLCQTA